MTKQGGLMMIGAEGLDGGAVVEMLIGLVTKWGLKVLGALIVLVIGWRIAALIQ